MIPDNACPLRITAAAGYYVNQVSLQARSDGELDAMQGSDVLHAKFILLQRGKNAYHLLVAG